MRRPRNWHREHKERLTAGQRAADAIRNGMGSWPFVFVFIGFLVVWTMLNVATGIAHWDNYPFILLNLFLSMLAALQGAILLIAARRQDSVNAAMAEHDYETNLAAKEEIEQLMTLCRQQLLAIRKLTAELEAGNDSPQVPASRR